MTERLVSRFSRTYWNFGENDLFSCLRGWLGMKATKFCSNRLFQLPLTCLCLTLELNVCCVFKATCKVAWSIPFWRPEDPDWSGTRSDTMIKSAWHSHQHHHRSLSRNRKFPKISSYSFKWLSDPHTSLWSGVKNFLYHVSDGVIKKLTSRGLVKVSDHPEGHRTDVAIIWQQQKKKERLSRGTNSRGEGGKRCFRWKWAKIYVGNIPGCKNRLIYSCLSTLKKL